MGIGVSVASVALGASVVDKHFTPNRADGGVDSTFSMEPAEMAQLVIDSERAWQALCEASYGPIEKEKKSLVFRRSLSIMKDIKAGVVLTQENLRAICPGLGLAPKYFTALQGVCFSKYVKMGAAMYWDLI